MTMQRYRIEVRVDDDSAYLAVECSGDMPFILADEIKKVVKEFYNK